MTAFQLLRARLVTWLSIADLEALPCAFRMLAFIATRLNAVLTDLPTLLGAVAMRALDRTRLITWRTLSTRRFTNMRTEQRFFALFHTLAVK